MSVLSKYVSVTILCVWLLKGAPQPGAAPAAAAAAWEDYVASIGVQAYVYGFPLFEMYRTRQKYLAESKPTANLNELRHSRNLLTASFDAVVAPNTDTLYSSAWLDLANGPMILHVPEIKDRYYSVQLLDFYTNHFATIGRRSEYPHFGSFAIAGPGWKGGLPAGITRIDSPTNSVWLIVRILLRDEADKVAVHAIQDQFSLTPLRKASATSPDAGSMSSYPAPGEAGDLSFFETLNQALRENPPPASEAGLFSLFAKIGIDTRRKLEAGALEPATARGLRRAVTTANGIIAAAMPLYATRMGGGWFTPRAHIGSFGEDYLFRAVVAKNGLGANVRKEAAYAQAIADDGGEPFLGGRKYVVRFEPHQLPPVNAFWSVTLYRSPSRALNDNPIGRYSVGDRSKDVKRGADGSLEIYVQKEPPEESRMSNWLPAPDGPWTLTLRMYEPGPSILDGIYRIPPVKRVP